MNEFKQALLAQLDALIVTMTQVKETEGKIYMDSWIEHGVDGDIHDHVVKADAPKIEHFCGAAACICGYQVLSNRLDSFTAAKDAASRGNEVSLVSSVLDADLKEACQNLFDDYALATSISATTNSTRYRNAANTHLFTNEEMETLKHLTSDEPRPEDALEYIVACREKVGQFDA
jgi:hypothetical protein